MLSQAVIAWTTLGVMCVLGMAHVSPDSGPPASRRIYGWAMWLTVVVLLLALTGCSTRPAEQPPHVWTPCEPLALCDIPPAANSTQLETALWACVLEYRAQYSSCATRQTH